MQSQSILIFVFAVFILYRIYLRMRRNVGWQLLNPGKMRVMITILSIIGLIFLIDGVLHPISLISDAIGILIGVILAYYGASLTRFDKRDGRSYYRPNTWIGSIVTLMFLGRLIYRIYDISTTADHGGLQDGLTSTDGLQAMATGWTAGLLLVMFAYYVVYYGLLLQKQRK